MSQPRVTVITPSYNRAAYIGEVIDSVLAQGYADLEYLVLDDGSTDGSAEVLARYADRVSLHRHPNMGETATVNKALAMATGEIIGIVNSDDPLYPGAIARVVAYMEAHPEVLVVYPDWDMIDQDGHVLQRVETAEFDYATMLTTHHCIPGPGAFFRRRVVEALGGRDPAFRWVADYDFWLRAGLLGPFARIPEALATFRVHPGSASVSQQGDAMAREHPRLIEKLFATLNLPDAVKRLESEAMSGAYYVGGLVSGEPVRRIRWAYFARAIACCPAKYMGRYRVRLLVMALALLPLPVRERVRRLKRFVPGIVAAAAPGVG